MEKVTNNSESGYCKMPDGTLIQWGSEKIASGTSSKAIAFQIAFNNANNVSVTLCPGYDNSIYVPLVWGGLTTTGFTVYRSSSESFNQAVKWTAIGRWK